MGDFQSSVLPREGGVPHSVCEELFESESTLWMPTIELILFGLM
jgi:hypothetical protein